MEISSIKKALKITILMTVILALPIMYTMATESVISYTLSEDKKSAVIHLDVNKVIGSNDLIEVKDQDNNLLTEYDIRVTENKIYEYVIVYKDNTSTPEDILTSSENLTKNMQSEMITQKISIEVSGIELIEKQSEKVAMDNVQPILEEVTPNKYFKITADGTVTFDRKLTPELENVVIPSQINNITVTSLGRNAFEYCFSLKSITIPESVTSIQAYAFRQCRSLSTLQLPKGITKIDIATFEECDSLANIEIPQSVTEIGVNAFKKCKSLSSLYIPEGVNAIGAGAFLECSSLENIPLPSQLMEIKDDTFSDCTSLLNINLPKTVKKIGSGAFNNCSSLMSIDIPESVSDIGSYAFRECKSLKSMTLPEGITSIANSLFTKCQSLENIVIPKSVTSIGSFVFERCSSLKSITMPPYLSDMGEWVFYLCGNLRNIVIPEGVQIIKDRVFNGCSLLENVVFPESLIEIRRYAFFGCDSLDNIAFKENLTTIGEGTFGVCTSLSSVILPEGMITIGEQAFTKCEKLIKLIIPSTLTNIGDYAFELCSLADVQFSQPVSNISMGINVFANQKYEMDLYETNQGQFVDFSDLPPDIVVEGIGTQWEIKNGYAKSLVKDPKSICYSYELLKSVPESHLNAIISLNRKHIYEVSFICNNKEIDKRYVSEGDRISFPKIPVRDGYTGLWDKSNVYIHNDDIYTVIYKAKPSISNSESIEVSQDEAFNPNDQFIFKDADGNIINDVIFTGEVDTKQPGKYVLEYVATDQWGGQTTGICVINVNEKSETENNSPIQNVIDDKNNIDNLSKPTLNNKSQINHNVMTSDDAQILLWSIAGAMSMLGTIMLVKKGFSK